MALSWSEQILPAGAQTVNVEMPYLDRSYIHVYLNDVEVTDFTWSSPTLIRLDAQLTEPTTVAVVRRTDRSFLYILFAEGAAFIKENLDTQNTQFLHLSQELVEGRSIDGFFGEINMNGYKITNLKAGEVPGDAVNKEQLDAEAQRITQLEQSFPTEGVSYPWYQVTTSETNTISPGMGFTRAALYLNGVCQTPGYSYSVANNVITLADPVPAGTHVFARLGEDTEASAGPASTEQVGILNTRVSAVEESNSDIVSNMVQLSSVVNNLDSNKANKGTNSDITSLTNLTGGIRGVTNGAAAPAGTVGELIQNSPTAVPLTTGTITSIGSITLTAGNWAISGGLRFQLTSATTAALQVFAGGFALTNGQLPSAVHQQARTLMPAVTSGSVDFANAVPTIYLKLSSTQTIYLSAVANFSGGTVNATGSIDAVRIN